MVSWLDDAQAEDDEFIEAAKAIRLLALDVDRRNYLYCGRRRML